MHFCTSTGRQACPPCAALAPANRPLGCRGNISSRHVSSHSFFNHGSSALRLTRNAAAATAATPLLVNDPFSGVDASRGFLPASDPLQRLHIDGIDPWEAALAELPKLVAASGASGVLRHSLLSLPPFPLDGLKSPSSSPVNGPSFWRAYLLLSFLSHAYVWCEGDAPAMTLPALLAVPWAAVAARLDMPPVLVHATYNLYNWRRLDTSADIKLGNVACLQV